MTIASLTAFSTEYDLLEGCLAGLQDLNDRIVVISPTSYSGIPIERKDIEPILKRQNATLVWTDMHLQHEQRNRGLEALHRYDWAMVVDCDEWYTEKMVGEIIDALPTLEANTYKVKMRNFFRYANYEIADGPDSGTPFLLRKGTRFSQGRTVLTEPIRMWDGERPYHFSYVRTPEQMRKKLAYFSHHDEVVPGFYEEKWLPFDGTQENLHPTNPPIWKSARKVELPPEIVARVPSWAIK